ncbi:MBL fold metallo-hydrolase [Mesorhizobium sp. YC-39]|uniref:MBL fold metallo-hydrolase n=1 Tax=unclassified Mesorhizobium TaxID=325217 RepID=UPI0021E7B178|nr:MULTISPECIES: MBL fold metallo-hydrolase [unclassified Mesorhizobium]MCV3205625.1 MBL fold metallo-hydrolase [Mesorhizobium sp. YC-2]MCV3227976.1 MBL fold metallo-hydrolase [Mesorhizobium sp. YC-39]
MIGRWRIGDIEVANIVEYYGPTHQPEIVFPEFDRTVFARRENELPPQHWYPDMNRLVIGIQLWVVFAPPNIIVVDTGVGNHKPRSAARMNQLNTLVPLWLEAAGVKAEKVTHVVMTHLHGDHVGWNTFLQDGRWAPTFPNARYVMPRRDFDYFKDLSKSGRAGDSSFADSVLPIVQASLADFIDGQTEVADCLRVTDAIGHTPGQLNYWLRSGGEAGVFSADIFHHPVQILNPAWNTAFCVLADEAKSTRLRFLDEASKASALVMPCHFPPPHCGFIRRQGDGFAYEPAS